MRRWRDGSIKSVPAVKDMAQEVFRIEDFVGLGTGIEQAPHRDHGMDILP